jgi:hypothetical protein
MLPIHLRLGIPSGLFPSGFSTNNLDTFLFYPIRATYPAHLIFLDLIILIILGEEHKLCSCSLCSLLHPPLTPSLFGPNVVLSTLYSNTISILVCTFLNVRDHVSHHKTVSAIFDKRLEANMCELCQVGMALNLVRAEYK